MPFTVVLIPRAVGNKQNNIPWFRGYAGALIPRAFGNKQNNIPWFRGYAGVLILRAFWKQTYTQLRRENKIFELAYDSFALMDTMNDVPVIGSGVIRLGF